MHWLLALKKESKTGEDPITSLKQHLCVKGAVLARECSFGRGALPLPSCHAPTHAGAAVICLDVPNLRVGALDVVLCMSDELQKVDSALSALLRKAERQVAETHFLHTQGAGGPAGAATSGVAAASTVAMAVDEVSVQEYLEHFEWDSGAWDEMEALQQLAGQMREAGEAADRELRRHAAGYSDALARLTALEKAKTGTLMTAQLEAVLTQQVLADSGVSACLVPPDSEYLRSVVFILPKSLEAEFLDTYESLDPSGLPVTDEAGNVVGASSPIVPRSAVRLMQDRDYVAFHVAIMAKFQDSIAADAKKRRWALRNVDWEAAGAADDREALSQLSAEVVDALKVWRLTAGRTFSTLYSTLVHVKVLTAFVNAVLNYGLPAVYTYCLVRVDRSAAPAVAQAITAATVSNHGDSHAAEDDAADAAFLAATGGAHAGAGGGGPKESDPVAVMASTLPVVAVPVVSTRSLSRS